MHAAGTTPMIPSRITPFMLVLSLSILASMDAFVQARQLSLDLTFGEGGFRAVTLSGSSAGACALGFRLDGSLLMVGASSYAEDGGGNEIVLVAMSHDGELDRSFANEGVQTLRVPFEGGVYNRACGLAEDDEGRILINGEAGGQKAFVAARFLPDGTPDTTFGDQGVVVLDPTPARDEGIRVFPLPDGRSWHGIKSNGDFVSVMLMEDGTPDPSYGTDGIAFIDAGDYEVPFDYAMDPQGRLVGVGFTGTAEAPRNTRVVVARFLPDGSPDPSLGGRGHVDIDLPETEERAFAVHVDEDGILVVGESRDPVTPIDYSKGFVLRLTDDGALDPTFSEEGVALVNTGQVKGFYLSDAMRDAVGNYVLIGEQIVFAGDRPQAFVRLTPDGQPDTWLSPTGMVDIPYNIGDAIVLDDDRLVAVAYDAAGLYGFPSALSLVRFQQPVPVGVEMLPSKEGMEVSAVWPNPAGATAMVELGLLRGPVVLSVIDVLGREHVAFRHTGTISGQRIVLDTSRLTPGPYWIRVRSADGVFHRPFVRGGRGGR